MSHVWSRTFQNTDTWKFMEEFFEITQKFTEIKLQSSRSVEIVAKFSVEISKRLYKIIAQAYRIHASEYQ